MKNFYRLCLLCFGYFLSTSLQAAPGDTTTIQSHTATQLSNYGQYNSPAAFPSSTKTYQKINMTFTLGKYQCPGNPQYCGDWDYTVLVYVLTPTDTLEIGRLITPYAGISRFPYTWQHRYVFDVTDYAGIFKDTATIRVMYKGYSGGFTANIKFDFIEGTPPRNVVGIQRAWHGYFNYGNAANPIEARLDNRSFQMPANAQSASLKLYMTGHGGNTGDNCAEFCQKYYQVKLNNNLISQRTIWRDNCGSNNLYPQTGTWVFDRANWCPGDLVTPYMHTLNGLSAGNPFTLDVDYQPYLHNNSQAGWELEGQVIYYGAYNYTTDASVENIVSPSDNEAFYRDNQVCQEPKIEIKNTGSTAITSLNLEYGLINGIVNTYTWQGSLDPGSSSIIALPTVPEIQNVTTSNVKFVARITGANGGADANTLNNELTSTFTPLATYPNNLVFTLRTNNASAIGGNETSWRILDNSGNVVAQRVNNPNLSTLIDTVSLAQGCYRFEMNDAGCDGINWWFYQYYQPNPGNGSFNVKESGRPAFLPVRGYFAGDFGCGFSYSFYVATPLQVTEKLNSFELNVYPNPASEQLQIKISGKVQPAGKLKLVNTLGQVVSEIAITSSDSQIDVKNIASGVYTLTFTNNAETVQKKVVITH